MIATLNKTFAPLHDVKLFGLREREATEFYEFGFVFENGVVRSYNKQFRLVLPSDHPGLDRLIESGAAMDPTKFVNQRCKDLQGIAASGKVGDFVAPTLWAITKSEVEPDYAAWDQRANDVLGNHTLVDAMRSPVSGTCSLREDGVDSVIVVESEGQDPQGYRVKGVPNSDIIVGKAVHVTEPLFHFAPNASQAAKRWVSDKISLASTTKINGQVAHDISLLADIPEDAFIWLDAKKNAKYFSMPANWSDRFVQFQVRSPHRNAALKAAGILAPA